MGCFYCCCCTLLVLINVVFMLIGLVLMIGGIFLFAGKDLLMNVVTPMLQSMINSYNQNGNQGFDASQIKNLFTYLTPIGIALIVVGAILFILSITGMCSVCCKSKVTLIIYMTILSVIIIVQIVVVSIYAADNSKIQNALNDLLNSMITKYESLTSTNLESFLINMLQIGLNCCGAQSYVDFNKSPNFNRTLSGTYTYQGETKTYNLQLKYPISCCQSVNFRFVNMENCLKNGEYNNEGVGCTPKLYNLIKQNLTIVYQIVGGIIGFQGLILIVAIICLVSLYQEDPVKPV